jgi:hypothetical protein
MRLFERLLRDGTPPTVVQRAYLGRAENIILARRAALPASADLSELRSLLQELRSRGL